MTTASPTSVRYAEPKGIALLEALTEARLFIFSTTEAQEASTRVGLAPGAVETTLRRLADAGWVERLRRGRAPRLVLHRHTGPLLRH